MVRFVVENVYYISYRSQSFSCMTLLSASLCSFRHSSSACERKSASSVDHTITSIACHALLSHVVLTASHAGRQSHGQLDRAVCCSVMQSSGTHSDTRSIGRYSLAQSPSLLYKQKIKKGALYRNRTSTSRKRWHDSANDGAEVSCPLGRERRKIKIKRREKEGKKKPRHFLMCLSHRGRIRRGGMLLYLPFIVLFAWMAWRTQGFFFFACSLRHAARQVQAAGGYFAMKGSRWH